jgi:hypothetical protein
MVVRTKNQSFQMIAGAFWRAAQSPRNQYRRENSIKELMLSIHCKLGFSL